ncbi:MAG: ribonuclease III [Oligoflexia bacterium]|nr:ribonuclease III [Oligoflexia bacterium]
MRFGIVKPADGSADSGTSDDQDSSQSDSDDSATDSGVLGQEHYPALEEKLGYKFKEYPWLQRALTHRSLQLKGAKTDYERLEFLGDAVLDLAIAHLLLDRYQEAKEGDLSKMRAALVNTTSLAQISRKLGLGPYIRLSRGELANGGADRPSILADVFEALMGAVYREGGYLKALEVISRLFGEMVGSVEPRDPKTELQEALHARGAQAPTYLLECVEGPEHAPTFVSIVKIDDQMVGRGRGPTKKASQQAAAAEALLVLNERSNPADVEQSSKE